MSARRGVIRKTYPVRSVSLDDRDWPVVLALMTLVGLAVALVIASSRFDEPRLLHNAWFQLVVVALGFAVLLTLVAPFRAQLTQRLQLALTLSLIGHLLLAAVLANPYAELCVIDVADRIDQDSEERPEVIPEYHVRPVDEMPPTEAFERPYQVKAPEAQTEELTREQAKARETEAMRRRATLPDVEPALEPSPIELRRPQMAAAHLAAEASRLSRQPPHAAAPWSERIIAPRPHDNAGQQVADTLRAQRTPVIRRQTNVTISRSEVAERHLVTQVGRMAAPQTVRVARGDIPALVPNRSARTPTPTRRAAGLANAVAAEIEVGTATGRVPERPHRAPMPMETFVRRQRVTSPRTAPRARATVAVVDADVGPARRPHAETVFVADVPEPAVPFGRQLMPAVVAGSDLPVDSLSAHAGAVTARSAPQPAAMAMERRSRGAHQLDASHSEGIVQTPKAFAPTVPDKNDRWRERPGPPVAVGWIAEVARPRRTQPEASLTSAAADDIPAVVALPNGPEHERAPGRPAPTASRTALDRARPSIPVGSGLVGTVPIAEVSDAGLPRDVALGVVPRRRHTSPRATVRSGPAPSAAGGMTGAPLRKTDVASLGVPDVDAVADVVSRSDQVESGSPALDTAAGRLGRVHGSLIVRADAAEGPGGLGTKVTPEVGLPHRKARRESEIVHTFPGKYLQRKIGAPAAISGRARDVAAAFTRRGQRQRELMSGGDGRSLPETEMAIELGLAFLARHQLPDGRWSLRGSAPDRAGAESQAGSIQADTAATGLALLAYLGAGYDHYDDKYQDTVQRGLDFLTDHQQAAGGLFLTHDRESDRVAQLYSHGIAAIALCEAVGMTGDPMLKGPAQAAVDFIARSQHPQRGGWRYRPRQSSDLSVTSWHLMALKSGTLAGMDVPEETFTRAMAFLDRCRGNRPRSPLYVYNPYAPNTNHQRHGRGPSTVMTSIGLLMRLYTGSDRTDPEIRRGADHLLANLPRIASPAPTGTLGNPMRDTYYWYHATQVMFHMRGRYWSEWNKALHPILVDAQIRTGPQAGSWDSRRPVPDRWGYHGGRFYVTTMNLLSLEVTYRHLPIYENALDRSSRPAAP